MRILLVEDDREIVEVLEKALTSQDYLVDLATDGLAGWELALSQEYDLILLDLMLPKLGGISFCRQRRQLGDRTPILLMTAQDPNTNKVFGLDAGADDYVVKPFDLPELLARIRALLRRGSAVIPTVIEWGNLQLNLNRCQITYNQQLLQLTAKEYALLELFLHNPRRIFSQSALLDRLWLFAESPSENTVRVHIKSLRHKLKQVGASADLIETIYGFGYRLKARESGVAMQKAETAKAQVQNLATTAAQVPQPMPPQMAAIWERHKGNYSDRITVLEQTVMALLQGTFKEELRPPALREAHTLAGSLGSFGFTHASQISREIEQILQLGESLSQTSLDHLWELVTALRQNFGQTSAIATPQVPQIDDNLVQLKAAPLLEELEVKPTAIKLTPIQPQAQLLVVDDDLALAEQLISEASAWGMEAQIAGNLSAAREAIARQRPDVVLLDLCFPDSEESGLALLAELVTYEPPLPVVVFTAGESFVERVKVARLGGRGFLQKPISPGQVMEAIAHVLQQSSTPEAKLLIVDDDPQVLDILRTLLQPWGFKLTLLDDPHQFWDTLVESDPDLLILDVEMPDFSGIDLCRVVRNDPHWSELPVLFLSAQTDDWIVDRVFAVGGDDYVHKPIVGAELVARVLNRLERIQTLRKLAETDPLTGLPNRRKFVQELNWLLHLAKCRDQTLCFVILDLDHFKQVNDLYGHDIGDRVLCRLAQILKKSFRNEDVVARWGGEEFAIGLYGLNREQGVMRIVKLLEIIRQQDLTDVNNQIFHISFSAGVAEYPQNGGNLESLYRSADAALYQAKMTGRNRVLPAQSGD